MARADFGTETRFLPGVEQLEALTHGEGARALEEAIQWEAPGPAEVARLRRSLDAATASAALEVARARRSLRGRMAGWADFWCDRESAAQSSDDESSAWKARRFDGVGPTIDLCCGAGADLAAITKVTTVRGVDLRPERAWMAGRNASCATITHDVTALAFDERVAHIDPSRRDESSHRRMHGWDVMTPDGAFIARLAGRLDGLMVKLGPGVEIPPDAMPHGGEVAVLSRGGRLTQAVLTTGSLSRLPGRRIAVLLQHGVELSGAATWTSAAGDPQWPAVEAWERFIAEPDPSLERSGLLPVAARAEGLRERAAGLGLCTGAEVSARPSPWFRWFERIDSLPARLDHVAAGLRRLHAGIVDVKVRAGAADADEWSRALRSDGPEQLVVFVHRIGSGAEAVIARRV
jgi:hypothetical protein